MKLSEKEKQYYNKIRIFASIEGSKIQEKNLTDSDLFEICKYSEWKVINANIAKRLKTYKTNNGNTCLHIAAQYDNKDMVINLVQNKIVDPNSENIYKENALMHCLKTNTEKKSQKIGFFLKKNTNLKALNVFGKMAHEIQQKQLNPLRDRLLKQMQRQSRL